MLWFCYHTWVDLQLIVLSGPHGKGVSYDFASYSHSTRRSVDFMWHKISSQMWVLFGVKCIIILSVNYPLNKTCIHHNNLQKASITKYRASTFKQPDTIIYIKFLIQTVTKTKHITLISGLCKPSHSHNNSFWHYQNFLCIIYTDIMLTLFLEGDKPSLWMSFSGAHFLKPSLISENL